MRGLVVHEWLEPRGGAEKVVDAMLETFPDADLVALWNDAPEKYLGVQESWLARTALRHHKAAAVPLLPYVWRHIVHPRDDIDFTLVSSHLFAHHVDVRTTGGERIPKFVYTHTPARYIWEPALDPRGRSPFVRAISAGLKPLDRERAQEATKVAANSQFVRDRIRRSWHRDADVIYPPVDVRSIQEVPDWSARLNSQEHEQVEALPECFILGASRFVPYKRLDWVIEIASMIGIPAVIAGVGPDDERLLNCAKSARVPITFVKSPSSAELYALFQAAQVYVFPAVEDFGIMPVEAQALGVPVAVTSKGGAQESVTNGVSGVVAGEDTLEAMKDAVIKAMAMNGRNRVSEQTLRFDTVEFRAHLSSWVTGGSPSATLSTVNASDNC